jgi:hypothetical protein
LRSCRLRAGFGGGRETFLVKMKLLNQLKGLTRLNVARRCFFARGEIGLKVLVRIGKAAANDRGELGCGDGRGS